MLVVTHFAATSVVAVEEEQVVGLVSAYVDPDRDDTLFVWQVAVDASMRGRGVALGMLESLLARDNLADIRRIETTISPSNEASQSLFRRLASRLETEMTQQPHFDRELFGGEAHEDEHLFSIGPFNRRNNESI